MLACRDTRIAYIPNEGIRCHGVAYFDHHTSQMGIQRLNAIGMSNNNSVAICGMDTGHDHDARLDCMNFIVSCLVDQVHTRMKMRLIGKGMPSDAKV